VTRNGDNARFTGVSRLGGATRKAEVQAHLA